MGVGSRGGTKDDKEFLGARAQVEPLPAPSEGRGGRVERVEVRETSDIAGEVGRLVLEFGGGFVRAWLWDARLGKA